MLSQVDMKTILTTQDFESGGRSPGGKVVRHKNGELYVIGYINSCATQSRWCLTSLIDGCVIGGFTSEKMIEMTGIGGDYEVIHPISQHDDYQRVFKNLQTLIGGHKK